MGMRSPSGRDQSIVALRHGDVEGYAVVVCGQGLQVGADLVAGVTVGGNTVRAGDAEVDLARPHQVAPGVVDDHGVRHAVLEKLPGGEAGALVARTGLVHPDVQVHAALEGGEDRAERGAPVDGRQPAGVAVGEDVQAASGLLGRRFQDRRPVAADGLAGGDVLFRDAAGFVPGGGGALGSGEGFHEGGDPLHRPAQVDRRRPGSDERVAGSRQAIVGGVLPQA